MFLRDIQLWADDSVASGRASGFVGRFRREVFCVVLPYLGLIHRKVLTRDCPKIFVLLFDGRPTAIPLSDAFYQSNVQFQFDFAGYARADANDKKFMILDVLHGAALWAAGHDGWDTVPLHHAYDTIRTQKFDFTFWSNKRWVHPSRKVGFRVSVRPDLDQFWLAGVLYAVRGKQNLRTFDLGPAIPVDDPHHYYMREGEWVDRHTFVLRSQTWLGEKWTVNVTDEDILANR